MGGRWNSLVSFLKGPSSSGDSNVALFDGTSGKLLKDSSVPAANVVIKDANLTDNAVIRGHGGGQSIQTNSNVYIDDNGKMGIGDSTPSNLLDVTDVSGSDAIVRITSGASSGDPFLKFETSGVKNWSMGMDNSDGDKLKISESGALASLTRITVDAGAVRFNAYGAGTLSTDSSGNITASSDRSLKENIHPFKRGLKAILGLKPRVFNWNKKSGLNQKDFNAGFIAQEVEKMIPEAVSGEEGSKTLTDRAIIATLVNAVQELNARVKNLEK